LDTSFLNWPFFEGQHRLLASSLDKWAAQSLPKKHVGHDDVDEACRNLVVLLAEGGWLRNAVPAAYGGNSDKIDLRSLCLSRETLARHSGLADFAFAMQGLGSGAISLYGNESQCSNWLPSVASGEKIAAFALSEPDAGSDVAAMSTRAERQGEGYLLNGCKTWISNGGIADFYTVFARTDEAPGAKGISCFVVDADTPGLEITERIDVIAPHPLARLEFRDCLVPSENLVGEPGRGFGIALGTLDLFRSTVGAAALGFARRALDEAINYTRERGIYGGKLIDLPQVRGEIGQMALDIDASALLIYRAAWARDSGAPRITREAAMAKLHATEAAQRVIDQALQLHGGQGVVSGSVMESLYREIRALRIYEGASEVQKSVIASQVLS
jgi:acyl-CoA dehydrogenase